MLYDRMRKFQGVFIIVMATGLLSACGSSIEMTQMMVEHQDGSQPLATATPRFGWQYDTRLENVRQLDYRIVVASTPEKAAQGIGDLWDSKQVASNQMLFVPYGGYSLQSRQQAFWKTYATVCYGKRERRRRVESKVNSFEISLLDSNDWKGQWIGATFDDDQLEGKSKVAARYLRREFDLKGRVKSARLYVSGLGLYNAFINGVEVAPEELLKPTLSDYTRRVYFNTYDVTSMLQKGMNAIGVVLEGGRYTTVRYNVAEAEWGGIHHFMHYGMPQLLLQLEVTYDDGGRDTIVSDERWRISNQGPIRMANEFDGEVYDARCELGDWSAVGFDDSGWQQVERMPQPGMAIRELPDPSTAVKDRFHLPKGEHPILCAQPNPNIKVQDRIRPVALFRKGNKWVLDMGQNMVGTLDIKVRSQRFGDTVTLRFAETLNHDSTLYVDNLRTVEATDRYICAGDEACWRPVFVFHGFRYVEIDGLRGVPRLEDFEGLVMYDEMKALGSFCCSNEVMNAIYGNAFWGIRGNYRSMPTDCPQRDERLGWTGDRTTGCYGESYLFDNHRLYSKWLTDAEDSQWANGSLSDVMPAYWRRYTDNMTWPGAFITVADMLYMRYGDSDPIRQHYDAMKRWMIHMRESYTEEGVITRDCYGDWCMPPEQPELIHSKDSNRITAAPLLSSPFYFYLAGKMVQFASLLGKDEDVAYFDRERSAIRTAFNKKYLDSEKGYYGNNTVTANILPLWFGMVPKEMEHRVFDNIIQTTEQDFDGHVSTGVVGIQQLMRTLTEYGRGDVALRIATNESYPSWGYMVRNGATTIWELWNGNTADPAMNSGNHVMLLGDLLLWEYEYLGGISALEPGYSKIRLKPYMVEGLDDVDCSYESVSGMIRSEWKRRGHHFVWDIVVPPNTTAEVWIPTANGYRLQSVGSGRYHFKSKL